MITIIEANEYEIAASRWAHLVSWNWAQDLAGRYFAWKLRRKYARYEATMRLRARLANEYRHGAEGNDPAVELAVSLHLIMHTFGPKDTDHPTCVRERKRVKALIQQMAAPDLGDAGTWQ